MARSPCPRLLPHDFPCWQTVYHVYRKWTLNHTWETRNGLLRAQVRAQEGKRCRPTAAILDSQSVKSNPHGGEVGYDAAKKIKGRKRHILVDTLGLLLGIVVTPADTTERDGAQALLQRTLTCIYLAAPALGRWRLRRHRIQQLGQKLALSTRSPSRQAF